MTDAALRRDADLALAVYLEPHAERRYVLIVGELDDAVDRHWASVARGVARLGRVDRELPRRERPFGLVVVTQQQALGRDPFRAVSELRGLLAPDGLMVVVRDVEGSGRGHRRSAADEFEELLGHDFRELRVLAQTPSSAIRVEELGAEDAGLGIDGSLVRNAAVLRHVAIASEARIALEARLLVQVPRGAAADDGARDELAARLDMAERDLDDMSAQVRALEASLADERVELRQETNKRAESQKAVDRANNELAAARKKLDQAEAVAEAARAEAHAAQDEVGAVEERLAERAAHITELESELERQRVVGRDLLEELRRLEREPPAAEPGPAALAVAAERDHAMQRALDAELAREALRMQFDELRGRLAVTESAKLAAEAASAEAEARGPDPELVGTVMGLRRRVAELELELAASQLAPTQIDPLDLDTARGERIGLRLRLDEAERAVSGLLFRAEQRESARVRELALELSATRREYETKIAELETLQNERVPLDVQPEWVERPQPALDAQRLEELERDLAREQGRTRELEDEVSALSRRVSGLEQDLDEADRLADEQEEDLARLDGLDTELKGLQEQLREREDELRSAQDELSAARGELAAVRRELEQLRAETGAHLELSQRRELETRAERDEARAALEEAKAILAQLQPVNVGRVDV